MCRSLFCREVLGVFSSLTILLLRKERAGCFDYFNCVVAVCVLCLFLFVAIIYELIQSFRVFLCIGLQPVIVAFPGHTHLLLADICPVSVPFSIASSHALIQKIPSGGPETFFKPSTYFTEGRMDLPREAIGPKGSNCFTRGVRTIISKETYSNL